MGLIFNFIWTTKLCLLGWSSYKACTQDNEIICILSVSYFCVLALATVCSWKALPTPKKIDALEDKYIQQLEEGVGFEKKKDE